MPICVQCWLCNKPGNPILGPLPALSGRHSKMRVYYLSWLRNKILKGEEQYAEGQKSRHGYTTVGNLEKCVHFRIGEFPVSATAVCAVVSMATSVLLCSST